MTTEMLDPKPGFWKMFHLSWSIFREQLKFILITLFGLSAAGAVKWAVISRLIPAATTEHWVAQLFTFSLFGFVGTVACIVIAKQSIEKRNTRWATIWTDFAPQLVPALVIHLVFIAAKLVVDIPIELIKTKMGISIITAGIALSIVPFKLALRIYTVFTFHALVVNKQRGLSAFSTSFRAVTGSWWKLFAVDLMQKLPALLYFSLIGLAISRDPAQTNIPLFSHIFSMAMMPVVGYFSIFYTVYFMNIMRNDERFSPATRESTIPTQQTLN